MSPGPSWEPLVFGCLMLAAVVALSMMSVAHRGYARARGFVDAESAVVGAMLCVLLGAVFAMALSAPVVALVP